MPTLTEIYQTFEAADFIQRVAAACLVAARTALTEDPATPDHLERARWARKVVLNPFQMAERMRGAVLLTAAVASEVPTVSDAAIQTGVNNNILRFAKTGLPEAEEA